jgi:hypothetical protein
MSFILEKICQGNDGQRNKDKTFSFPHSSDHHSPDNVFSAQTHLSNFHDNFRCLFGIFITGPIGLILGVIASVMLIVWESNDDKHESHDAPPKSN